eukprot:CAMPEP_0170545714 /NCGR_PEP_ID=MMETSP0211-20121228/4075_1 /TAXON_ID=311385 /ORGANISM="Pseudokeronopsis sp., Strain OXSARD2" /LENGTH=49 /DNA_ID=CAMNT_0010849765 /DNA_START=1407 /DNA_END=1556 /DNA_ORIENTATION=-
MKLVSVSPFRAVLKYDEEKQYDSDEDIDRKNDFLNNEDEEEDDKMEMYH